MSANAPCCATVGDLAAGRCLFRKPADLTIANIVDAYPMTTLEFEPVSPIIA